MVRVSRIAALFSVLSLCFAAAEAQTTIHIPADQPTIQAGIDAAHTGDTVLVAPGTYFENIDFKGKAITVTSSGGAASTIIDGGSKGIVAIFRSGETRGSVLSGMTLQHGTTSTFSTFYGATAGVFINGSSPTLLNNTITQNQCWDIAVYSSAPLIQGNEISATLSPPGGCGFGSGAAIYIGGNFTGTSGTYNYGTPAQIIGNIIEKNVMSGLSDAGGNGGAGVAVWGGTPIIDRNIFRNNSSPGGSGGAINVVYGTATIVNNLMVGNSAGCGGGALAFQGGAESGDFYILVANNTMVDNVGQSNAGYSECTKISQIYPAPDSYGTSGPSAVLVNNIIAGSSSDPAVNCSWFQAPSEAYQPIFDHNVLFNAGGAFFGSFCKDVSTKYGNIAVDPQFVNPATGDYSLKATSPAIDAGNNSIFASLATFSGQTFPLDLANNPRLQDVKGNGYPIVDMGAYEFAGTVNANPTTLVLTSSFYTGDAGDNDVLTATLASASGIPTGTVTFFLDGQSIGMSVIGSGGVATLPSLAFRPGVHALYATYPGQGSFRPAISVVLIVNIHLYRTSITVTSSQPVSLVGQPVTFTIKGTSTDGTIPHPVVLSDSASSTPLSTLTLDATGTATFTTSALTLGYHNIAASYAGDTEHAASSGSVGQQVVTSIPTNTTLSSSANPSRYGQNVTFTAHVSSGSSTAPTGSVNFTENQAALGSSPVDASGNASFATSTLTANNPGTTPSHSIVATYVPTGTASGSQASVTQVVNGLPVTNALTVTPTSGTASTVFTLTAVVAATGTGAVPTGTVVFTAGPSAGVHTMSLGTATLVNGVATLSSSGLSAGTDYLQADYLGSETYAEQMSNPVALNVNAAATAVTLSTNSNPGQALSPILFTASLTSGGKAVGAGLPITLTVGTSTVALTTDASGAASFSTATLLPGQYQVQAAFAGNQQYIASGSNVLTETVLENRTAISLNVTPNPAFQNQNVTMTVSVGALTGTVVPVGTVTLLDRATVLATIPTNGSFTISTLAPGDHIISATYTPGSTAFLPSYSLATALTVQPQDFTLTATPPSITIKTEHHASMKLMLSSIGGFTGPVQVRCDGAMPDWLTCQLPSGSVALAANVAVPITLTLDTDAVLGFKASNAHLPFAGVALAGLVLFGLRKRRRLGTLLALFVVFGISGCSGKYPASVTPGTYTVNIVATGQTAGSPVAQTHTMAITLTVTP